MILASNQSAIWQGVNFVKRASASVLMKETPRKLMALRVRNIRRLKSAVCQESQERWCSSVAPRDFRSENNRSIFIIALCSLRCRKWTHKVALIQQRVFS